jgi:hypothetical protein
MAVMERGYSRRCCYSPPSLNCAGGLLTDLLRKPGTERGSALSNVGREFKRRAPLPGMPRRPICPIKGWSAMAGRATVSSRFLPRSVQLEAARQALIGTGKVPTLRATADAKEEGP